MEVMDCAPTLTVHSHLHINNYALSALKRTISPTPMPTPTPTTPTTLKPVPKS